MIGRSEVDVKLGGLTVLMVRTSSQVAWALSNLTFDQRGRGTGLWTSALRVAKPAQRTSASDSRRDRSTGSPHSQAAAPSRRKRKKNGWSSPRRSIIPTSTVADTRRKTSITGSRS